MFQIEKNIPIPTKHGNASKYQDALSRMEIGDSFAFDQANETNIRSAALYAKKKTGRKFSILNLHDGTIRCWRTV